MWHACVYIYIYPVFVWVYILHVISTLPTVELAIHCQAAFLDARWVPVAILPAEGKLKKAWLLHFVIALDGSTDVVANLTNGNSTSLSHVHCCWNVQESASSCAQLSSFPRNWEQRFLCTKAEGENKRIREQKVYHRFMAGTKSKYVPSICQAYMLSTDIHRYSRHLLTSEGDTSKNIWIRVLLSFLVSSRLGQDVLQKG